MTLDLADLQQRLRAFAAARQWQPYHTPKNLAMALMVEAAELQELFQWLTPEESQQLTADPAQKERLNEAEKLLLEVKPHLQILGEHHVGVLGAELLLVEIGRALVGVDRLVELFPWRCEVVRELLCSFAPIARQPTGPFTTTQRPRRRPPGTPRTGHGRDCPVVRRCRGWPGSIEPAL